MQSITNQLHPSYLSQNLSNALTKQHKIIAIVCLIALAAIGLYVICYRKLTSPPSLSPSPTSPILASLSQSAPNTPKTNISRERQPGHTPSPVKENSQNQLQDIEEPLLVFEHPSTDAI